MYPVGETIRITFKRRNKYYGYKSLSRNQKIQGHSKLKEGKLEVEGGYKPKLRHFQKLTSTRKKFKAPATRLEDKVFDFRKQKPAADL